MLYSLLPTQTKLFFFPPFPSSVPIPSHLPRPHFPGPIISAYPELFAGIAVLALSAPLNAEFPIPVADPTLPLTVVVVIFKEAVATVIVVILLLPFTIGSLAVVEDDGRATGPRSTLAADGNCTSEDSGAVESGGKDEFAILVPAWLSSPARRRARSEKWPPTTGRALKKTGLGLTG